MTCTGSESLWNARGAAVSQDRRWKPIWQRAATARNAGSRNAS